jgi:F-type H+-transporting ATPase subunit gamma
MANIKELKKRIKSTKNTFKITKAMKLVSAAKLSRAQSRILGLKPYSEELQETVRAAAAVSSDYEHPYLKESKNKQSILLVISSDKGLCGGFNTNLIKKARNFVAKKTGESIKLYFIGKKAKEILGKELNFGKFFTFKKNEPSSDEIRKIADELAHLFTTGEVGKVYISYNEFFSAMNYVPVTKQILPFRVAEEDIAAVKEKYAQDFKYEPSAKGILDVMVPEVFVNSIYTAMLDSIAAEHGARMVAMENASKNCKELIKKVTLKMNKKRQAAITTELIEVVSGAESLKG